jgi:hypothetical protein
MLAAASTLKVFYVRNQLRNPKELSYAAFQLNEENAAVCTLGAGSYCSTEQFITLDYNAGKKFIFNLTSFKTIETGEQFTNIDNSCFNHDLKVHPDRMPIVDIVGRPTNILDHNTLIVCEYKDYE